MQKKKPSIRDCLVAFVDILGMKDRVLKIRTKTDLLSVYDEIQFVQDEFGKRIKDADIRKYKKIAGKKVLAFSDCLVISVDFKSPLVEDMGTFDSLLSEIASIGLAQAICICDKKIFLRGGIDIGVWVFKEDILISPPLIRAYMLESEETKYPVISVSKDAYTFFRKHPHKKFYADQQAPLRVFRKGNRNGKHFYFIDYLHIGFHSAANWHSQEDLIRYKEEKDNEKKMQIMDESYRKTEKSFLAAHKKAILHGLKSSRTNKIKKKYIWLRKYHNEFVDELGIKFKDCSITHGDLYKLI